MCRRKRLELKQKQEEQAKEQARLNTLKTEVYEELVKGIKGIISGTANKHEINGYDCYTIYRKPARNKEHNVDVRVLTVFMKGDKDKCLQISVDYINCFGALLSTEPFAFDDAYDLYYTTPEQLEPVVDEIIKY